VSDERLASSEARAHGAVLFAEHCALCHGSKGEGQGQRRAGFASRAADFTSSAWRNDATASQVFETIHNGKPGTSMPAWRSLSDDDIADLTAYVLSLGEGAR